MKSLFKRAIYIVALICVLPLIIVSWIASRTGDGDRFFQGASQCLSLAPFRLGVYLRAAYYSTCCTNVHSEVAIGFLSLLSHKDTDMDQHVYIGAQCNIGSCNIGRDCLLGSGVHVLSGKEQHKFSDADIPIKEQGGSFKKITIGENCWIGNNATIMSNIGSGSIVAAGSVVVSDVPPGSVVGGNPARTLKHR
ncbi:acyltransferase [Granulosicoccus sp.]|nr:acyltransferase [Granulosicoccus sp.]